MSRPKLLMLDEPSLELARLIVEEIFMTIRRMSQEGTRILLVEQNANAALAVSDHGHGLESGHITLSGTAAELRDHPGVRQAYLGQESAATSRNRSRARDDVRALNQETDRSNGDQRPKRTNLGTATKCKRQGYSPMRGVWSERSTALYSLTGVTR